MYRFLLCFSTLFALSIASPLLKNGGIHNKAVACPDSVLISPCVCVQNGNDLDMTCDGLTSLQSLSDVFGRTFPTNELHSIVVTKSRLDVLPTDVFRGKSFQLISFIGNRAASFSNANVLASSAARCTSLIIDQDTDEWVFNFANIQSFTALTYLEVTGYLLTTSGTLSNPSLNHVILRSDLISKIPTLGALPALVILDLDANVITDVPVASFAPFTRLTELYLGHNKIVSLATGTFNLDGRMTIVDLSSNLISELPSGWITGLSPTTTLGLLNNYISLLDSTIFESIITALVPTGKLLMDGNPLECGCEVAWVVTNAAYMTVVDDARCANGTRLNRLDPSYFQTNC